MFLDSTAPKTQALDLALSQSPEIALKGHLMPGLVASAYSSNTWEVEEGRQTHKFRIISSKTS